MADLDDILTGGTRSDIEKLKGELEKLKKEDPGKYAVLLERLTDRAKKVNEALEEKLATYEQDQ